MTSASRNACGAIVAAPPVAPRQMTLSSCFGKPLPPKNATACAPVTSPVPSVAEGREG